MTRAGPDRPVLLLTGGPAAGKSTTAAALVADEERGAQVEVDDVRRLVTSGGAAPWEGDEGRLQQRLGVENACDVALRLDRAGFSVVLTDVVVASTLAVYRRRLPHLVVVRLRVSLVEARRRARRRPARLTDAEFDALHLADADHPPHADHVVDVDGLDVQEQVDVVAGHWHRASSRQRPRSVLLLLNGLPGSGKTTTARRWVQDRPLAMVLDVDDVRATLGGWDDDLGASGLAARRVALAAARAHLEDGHDVVVPQLVARAPFLDQLEALADVVGARFVHVVLDLPPELSVERTARRARAGHPTAAVSLPEAQEYRERLAHLLRTRDVVTRVDVASTDVDGVLEEIRQLSTAPSHG